MRIPSSLTIALARRHLLAHPGYVAAVVLTLALGIGAATAMFSAVNAVILSPMGVERPEQVVVGWGVDPQRSSSLIELAYNDVLAVGAASPALTRTAGVSASTWPTTVEGAGEPIRLQSAGVSGTFFDLLQVHPALGRLLLTGDDVRGGADVIVLSHATWQRLFSGDTSVIGRALRLDDESATIVGVAPPEFDFPRGTDVWRPLAPVLARAAIEWRTDPFENVGILLMVGRLQPGATVPVAADQVTAAARARDAKRPVPMTGQRIVLEPFRTHHVGPARDAILALFGAVIILLLVACANVSGLVLSQAARRARVDAVQIALGADLRNLAGQRLIEATIVTIVGGALGLLVSLGAIRVMLALAPDGIPRLGAVALDGRVLAFAVGITAVSLLLIALAPLRHLRRLSVVEGLGDGGRTSASRRAVRTRGALLVLQTGLAVVLLVSAGVLARSFEALRRIDVGFQSGGVVTVRMDPRIPEPDVRRQWMDDLLATLRTRPGVRAAGAVYLRPMALGPISQGTWVLLEGQPNTPQQSAANPVLNYQTATPDYFRAMGIPLVRGRMLATTDDATAERVALVSAGTAARLWPGQDPIGKRILTSSFDKSEGVPASIWRRVVGVVADVRYRGLDQPSLDFYDPAAQSPMPAGDLVVRTDGNATGRAAMIIDAVRTSRPGLVVHDVQTLDAILARAMAPWRFAAWVFSLFGGAAFVLALLGLVSVVSLDIAQRRHELAVRIALGAPSHAIVRRAAGTAALRVSLGLACGLLASSLAVTALRGLLFGIHPFDWVTYSGVPLVVVATAALAAAVPVYGALHTNPASVLRRS